jgi:hypothetical protein
MAIEKLDFGKVISEKIPYTLVLNSVIQNIKNLEALAVWIYLYSKPTDWKVIKSNLKNEYHIGNKKIKDIFSYLNRCKLIKYTQARCEKGTLAPIDILVLNGEKFDKKVTFQAEKTTGSKIDPLVEFIDLTAGSILHPPASRTTGFSPLQKKENTKERKSTKKSFCENSKKHEFAGSMDQMANEAKYIKENEEFKSTPMPDSLRKLYKGL